MRLSLGAAKNTVHRGRLEGRQKTSPSNSGHLQQV